VDGRRKLVLGYVWQLMRASLLQLLKELGGGVAPKDADILEWANKTVAEGKGSVAAVAGAAPVASIGSFKDPALASR
jgi:branched-subunit amino acid aminotransferase/4-amino-4-deoxychorismate lyase